MSENAIEVVIGAEAPVEEVVAVEEPDKRTPRSNRAKARRAEPVAEAVTEPVAKVIPPGQDKVVIWVSHPIYWPENGKLSKGYNLVNRKVADLWIARGWARLASPEEVAQAYKA